MISRRPWNKLGCDLFHFNNNTYLLLADYSSKFPILRKLTSTSSTAVINHLKMIFSEHGPPETLMSDNGPQFSSQEFKIFSKEFGFDHITSSPHYPQSNGLIERMIQTVKNIMKKCHDTNADLNMALLCLRATPVSNNISSPCVLLNNRMYKTNLPSIASSRTSRDMNDALQQRQDLQKFYHDKNARPLMPLVREQPVRVLNPQSKQWQPGKVVSTTADPRSYQVESEGAIYRRNRSHLKPSTDETTATAENKAAPDPTPVPPTAAPAPAAEPPPLRRSSRNIKIPE